MNRQENIIVHCSASPDTVGKDWDGIRSYHINGRGWRDIGYHYGIELINGTYEVLKGRPDHQAGAHCREEGMNYRSLGVCLVGGDPWLGFDRDRYPLPPEQYDKLIHLCADLCKQYSIPVVYIYLHRDFAPKPCPGYAVNREDLRMRVAAVIRDRNTDKNNEEEIAVSHLRPVIRDGDANVAVLWLQHFLEKPLTGVYDNELKDAVIEYQQKNNLGVDGIVGPETWGHIFTQLTL